MTVKEKMQIMARVQMAKRQDEITFVKDDPGTDHYYDQFSGRFFKSNKATILAAELIVNRELNLNGFCYVQNYYDILGIDCPGNYIWNRVDWVDFDHVYVDYEDEYPYYHLIVMIPEPKILVSKSYPIIERYI